MTAEHDPVGRLLQSMTARQKAMLAMFHRWGEGYSLDEFQDVFDQEGPQIISDLRRVLDTMADDIESGARHFCEVCETIHPPVGPGQGLLVPERPEQARRVLDLHIRDEVRRAGPDGIPAGVVLARLTGQAPA